MQIETTIQPSHRATSLPTDRVSRPALLDHLAAKAVLGFLGRITNGELRVELPEGNVLNLGGKAPGPKAFMRIVRHRFFRRALKSGDIGFGEAYMDGDWETNDLTAVLSVLAVNIQDMDERDLLLNRLGRWVHRLRHALRRNNLAGSRRNIAHHYDLSNDFYRLWLDKSMLYSGAIYRSESETSAEAQQNKLDAMILKARIQPHHHVLEIGSGWGALAIEMAKRTGCRVTTITLSEEQLKVVRERVAAEGLEDRITPMLCDYRKVEGRFDRVLSIEMLEAVGHEYHGTFFQTVDRLLAPDGIAVLQVITIPDQRYERYRRQTDWIQQYIFPGAVVPSLTALTTAMTAHSRLVVENLENIGIHYARTLREWREVFHARLDEVRRLGFDERFVRMWDYYLCYCEAGFQTRILNNLQLVLSRPGNQNLPTYDA